MTFTSKTIKYWQNGMNLFGFLQQKVYGALVFALVGVWTLIKYGLGDCVPQRKETDRKSVIGEFAVDDVNVCLFGFYGILTFEGYLMPNPFLYK